ncbi:hypothetical protein NLG97_g1319 [Lecanicillium saksenae]|uniref:Uncharacterized protein n=1 Tax=Lecanicillium saksenae TaxID=468837 RepID=A0ACC1R4A8_9HYPO|nr:hypothetical protein NLG97_g1319 [Lecanicillium saksenae]
MSVDFTKVFVSDRLIYEAFDGADEETKMFLYHHMAKNPAIKGLDSIETFVPRAKSNYVEWLNNWKQCLLAVIICVKPDNWDEIANDYTREEHTKTMRGTPVGILYLETSSLNEGAVRVYKKAGFVEDGRDRESLFIAGNWYDTVHMSILEREWRARRGETKPTEV